MGEPGRSIQGIELFDATMIDAGCRGYSGAIFDGRYIYYAPLNNGNFHGRVLRYDTTLAFESRAAWVEFDSAQIDPDSRGFVNALFDGRYLYLVPYFNGRHHGHVTRYDTQSPFEQATSWQTFDVQSVDALCRGFVSGCFDGRYLYLASYQLDMTTTHGHVVRYDTQARFDDTASWQTFDTTSVQTDCRGFHSALSEGDYVYFVPYLRGGGEYSGMLARYDKRLPFDDAAAWATFDMTALHPGCRGYVGATCLDGVLYFAPYIDGQDRHGRVARYDTRQALDDLSAWSWFDVSQVDVGSRGFFGAICHENYLYLVPHCRGVGQYHGQLTRYDLRLPFDDPASWSICDLARVHSDCRGFIGGVLQGDYLYLAPFETDAGCQVGMMTRIDLSSQTPWSA